ncbi:hypothetical protein M9H77_14701 [Catharanthus roseus]|uniref:Uncharacterized protein n=1 Tax=Catharanthus roseus TaxID=4058 RepID=A0ACC0BP21_CATRO|nr:hypothetical protein M9H77_14701 [Catharanthus roseus]
MATQLHYPQALPLSIPLSISFIVSSVQLSGRNPTQIFTVTNPSSVILPCPTPKAPSSLMSSPPYLLLPAHVCLDEIFWKNIKKVETLPSQPLNIKEVAMKWRKRLASRVLPKGPTRRKSVTKRTEPDLNPRESENEAVSNSLERETVATPPLRQGSPTNEGHSNKFIIPIRRLEKKKAQIIYSGGRKEGLPDT